MPVTDYIVLTLTLAFILLIFTISYWGALGKDLAALWKEPHSRKTKIVQSVAILLVLVALSVLFAMITSPL